MQRNLDRFNLSNSEVCYLIDQWISGKNAERNRNILKDRLIRGMTYEDLAEKYELCDHRIKMIVYRTLDQLVKHL